jgi:NAD(P)-dependent dehydrogenase (short-subunit alcohol dehydrogenase family)
MKKVALVTGGSRGIGSEIALQLGARDVFVFINYSQSCEEAEGVKAEIVRAGGSAEIVCADVSDEAQVIDMFRQIGQVSARLDYVINNAGIDLPQPLEKYKADDWKRVIDVNLTGRFLVLRHAIPLLKQSASARVINIASVLAAKPLEEAIAYCCSEAAIVMLTKCAAIELAPHGIRVNTLSPGFTRTSMNERIYPDRAVWERVADANPLKRIGEPADVANAVMFLLSENADFINGSEITVDGGAILK